MNYYLVYRSCYSITKQWTNACGNVRDYTCQREKKTKGREIATCIVYDNKLKGLKGFRGAIKEIKDKKRPNNSRVSFSASSAQQINTTFHTSFHDIHVLIDPSFPSLSFIHLPQTYYSFIILKFTFIHHEINTKIITIY